MKNSFFIILVFLLTLSSCEKDFLDRQPLTEYSETTLWDGSQ